MKKIDKVFVTNGCSNHSNKIRQNEDYYATDPRAAILLCEEEKFTSVVYEPCIGGGHLAEGLIKSGYSVIGSDIVDRGYPNTIIRDFLTYIPEKPIDIDIITNPPYEGCISYVKHALDIVSEGRKVAMFLKLTFLEGKSRKDFFYNFPPKVVYVCSGRIVCAMNGDFETYHSSAIAYCWYVWEKGYKGDTIIKWIN